MPRHWLRAIRPEDVPALELAAAGDQHSVVAPTHLFEQFGEPVGYASVASVPLVITWFDSKRCQARDSQYFINQLELLLANSLPSGHHGIIGVPFGPPFQPLMDSLGYQDGGPLKLGFKRIK